MLNIPIKMLVGLSTVIIASGCLSDGPARIRMQSNEYDGVGFVLKAPTISRGGIATLSAVLQNGGKVPLCIAPDAGNTIQVNIKNANNGLLLFSQGGDPEYLDTQAQTAGSADGRAYFSNSIEILPGEKAKISLVLEPLVDAYFVDSTQRYVKDFTRNTPLVLNVEVAVFDCKFKSLNEALGAGVFSIKESNTVELVGNITAFVR